MSTHAMPEREWDLFHCRTCRRLLFKFDDGQKSHMATIAVLRGVLERAVMEARMTIEERQAIEATFKHERVIQIKCPGRTCHAMNYLVESVR